MSPNIANAITNPIENDAAISIVLFFSLNATEQNELKVPTLSAVNSIVTGLPTGNFSLIPYSGIAMPWGTSVLVIISLTLSPLLTSTVSGSNTNWLADPAMAQ